MSPSNTSSSRPAYKVEELLALRGSASESRVSVERFPDEDAIKDHVLKRDSSGRYSHSAENIQPSALARDGKRHPALNLVADYRRRGHEADPQYGTLVYDAQLTNPALTQPPNLTKRASPTPSLKRTKAERLIKEHGSPPHVRVTAGGRIVPSDLQQLGSPLQTTRTPSNMYQYAQGLQQTASAGYLAHNPFGRIVQLVDGTWIEITQDARGQPMYGMPLTGNPFLPINPTIQSLGAPPAQGSLAQNIQSVPMAQQNTTVHQSGQLRAQISICQEEYECIRREKIELERQEVKTADTLTAAQRGQIVNQKRNFVLKLDTIRKRIKELEGLQEGLPQVSSINEAVTNIPYSYDGADGVNGCYNYEGMQYGARSAQPMTGFCGYSGPTGTLPLSYGYGTGPTPFNSLSANSLGSSGLCQKAEAVNSSPPSDPSPSARGNTRRSHAVQIRDPNATSGEAGNGEHASHLNPTSPSYEPGKAYRTSLQTTDGAIRAPFPLSEASPPHFIVPAPTPIETPNPPPAELAKHWLFTQGEVLHRTDRQVTQFVTKSHQQMTSTVEGSDDAARTANTSSIARVGKAEQDTSTHNEEQIDHSSQNQTSHSSVTTTDFFPTNTHEHSFAKYMSRKASGVAHGSLEHQPLTPARDHASEVVSPFTDRYQPTCPPVSPAGLGSSPAFLADFPENMRMSSFLRDTACVSIIHQPGEDEEPLHSPVHVETRDEFQGRPQPYLEGYLAGSSGHAPSDPKDHEYCAGYIAGLSKSCVGAVPCESSTNSFKSQPISVSRTPPNTTENRSFIAELAGSHPTRHENVRLTQSVQHFSSPSGGQLGPSAGQAAGCDASLGGGGGHEGGDGDRGSHHLVNALLAQGTDAESTLCGSAGDPALAGQAHFPRSWSEDNSAAYNKPKLPSSSLIVAATSGHGSAHRQSPTNSGNDVVLSSPFPPPLPPAHSTKGTLTASARCPTTQRSDRLVSTSRSQHSLTGYSGNQPGARVGSLTQTSVFSDNKYILASHTETLCDMAGRQLQADIGKIPGRRSQYDGAMDDVNGPGHHALIEDMGDISNHGQRSYRVIRSPDAAEVSLGDDKVGRPPTTTATPQTSPSKSTSSPKKVTSPRHRMQQFATRVGDKVGEMFDRGNNGFGGERESRGESPDPARMGLEEKRHWKDGWRNKLHTAKAKEEMEYRKWRKDHPSQ